MHMRARDLHTHTGMCTRERTLSPTLCSLGGKGTCRSHLPSYPWHRVAPGNICVKRRWVRHASSKAHLLTTAFHSNFGSRLPSPRRSLPRSHSQGLTHLHDTPVYTGCSAAFSMYLPHQTFVLPGDPLHPARYQTKNCLRGGAPPCQSGSPWTAPPFLHRTGTLWAPEGVPPLLVRAGEIHLLFV